MNLKIANLLINVKLVSVFADLIDFSTFISEINSCLLLLQRFGRGVICLLGLVANGELVNLLMLEVFTQAGFEVVGRATVICFGSTREHKIRVPSTA